MNIAAFQAADLGLIPNQHNLHFWASFVTQRLKNLPTIQETSCNAGDPGLILGWGRSPGEGNVNPHQNSCLENSMDRGAWWPKVHGISRVGHDLVTNHHTRTHTSIYLYRQIQQ